MKKFFETALWIILLILFFPIYMLFTPALYISEFALDHGRKVKKLLLFGRTVIGGYRGKLRIGTTSEHMIYQTETFGDLFGKNQPNKYLMAMRVCNYRVDKDGYLFIKVSSDDRLLDKHAYFEFKKSKEKKEEK